METQLPDGRRLRPYASMGPRPGRPWRRLPLAEEALSKALQWGHGLEGRGDRPIPHRSPSSTPGFNGATAWKAVETNWASGAWCGKRLQWGHGLEGRGDGAVSLGGPYIGGFNGATAWKAVETHRSTPRLRLCIKLQWGHGLEGRGDHERCGLPPPRQGFNGATAWKAVETSSKCWPSWTRPSFNGATAWKAVETLTKAGLIGWSEALQWGHGLEGRGDHPVLHHPPEGRASMGPRPGRPWRRRKLPSQVSDQVLQWGHGLEGRGDANSRSSSTNPSSFNGATAWKAVETGKPESHRRRVLASMGPRPGRPWRPPSQSN